MDFFEYLRLPKEMRIDVVLEHGECEYDDGNTCIYSLYDFWVLTKQGGHGNVYFIKAYREWPDELD